MIEKKGAIQRGKIKEKLMKARKNWNDWNPQLHWNTLEWVDPKNKTLRRIHSVFRLTGYALKIENRHVIFVGH